MNNLTPFDDWAWFRLEELFEIKKGKRLTKARMTLGSTPFVGSSDSNNAWTGNVGQRAIHEGNTITVNYNGSTAEAFYQPLPFWASDDVNVLYPRFELSPYVGLFIATVIKQEKYRYNYGRKWHLDRMKPAKIMLPINSKKSPDWQKIEEYVKSFGVLQNYDLRDTSSIKKPFADQDAIAPKLEPKSWKWFRYEDLFDIERGRGPRKKDLDGTGKVPVVTSSDTNNGWTDKTSALPVHLGNTIGVNRNGSVAEAFYQPLPFCSTEDVHVFSPKFEMNKYVGLFFATLIQKEKYRYNYGRKWGIARMNDSRVKLPVNLEGQPDFEFMEEYIKSLPFSKQI